MLTLRSLIPPAVFQAKRALMPPKPIAAYGSYYEARQHSPGYDARVIAEVVTMKTAIMRDSLKASAPVDDMRTATLALAIRTAAGGNTLNCLDFGGAAGAHFFRARQLFGNALKLNWHVVETPGLVDVASKSLAGDGLSFFSDVDQAAKAFGAPVDLLLCSGTLQYMPDPMAMLETLCKVGARHALFTRTALADVPLDNRTIIQESMLSQNGPGPLPAGFKDEVMSYPATFADRLEAEAILAQHYSIDMRFTEDRGAYKIGNEPISMYGYLASGI